jgi:predicted KAP-like P-loop ATPase
MPPIDQVQLFRLFVDRLGSIIGDVPEERFNRERWALLFHQGIKPLLKTLRDIVRLNNTISLKYSFLKDEVDIIDLIGITTIQVFVPDLYNSMQMYKDELCGNFSDRYYSNQQNEKEEFQKLYETLINDTSEKNKEAVSEILAKLFPKVKAIVNNWSGGARYEDYESIRHANIYNNDYFDRYFSLSFSNGLSLGQANHIIFEASVDEVDRFLFQID